MTTIRTRITMAVLAATAAISTTAAITTGVAAHRADERADLLAADVADVRVRVGTGGQWAVARVAEPAEPGGPGRSVATLRLADLITTPIPGAQGFVRFGPAATPGWRQLDCRDGQYLHPDLRVYSAGPHDPAPASFVHSALVAVDPSGGVCVPAE